MLLIPEVTSNTNDELTILQGSCETVAQWTQHIEEN